MKISKKFISLLLAGAIFAAPVAGIAEEADVLEEDIMLDDEEFALYAQDEVFEGQLTLEEFDKGVEEAYKYLTQFINVNRQDLQCLYYLVNRESISDEDASILEGSLVHGTDIANGEFQNFIDGYKVINDILDYNQSQVKNLGKVIDVSKIEFNEYDEELFNTFLIRVTNNKNYTILDAIADYDEYMLETEPENLNKQIDVEMCLAYDPELVPYVEKVVKNGYDLRKALEEYNEGITVKLIDPSELIFDEDDKEIAHEMFKEYALSYKPVVEKSSLIENENYNMLFKQLTTLNAAEKEENAHELSVGPKFLVENVLGVSTINTIFDYLKETYPRSELDKYFDAKALNAMQWVVRDDISIDINCPKSELEVIVLQFGMLKTFAVDTVNNDLMTTFAMKCANKTK